MSTMELESFFQKFNLLWKNGHDAHLNVHSYAGNAWVGISLNLGSFPGPSRVHYPPRKKSSKSPARSRRREKRAAARAEAEINSNCNNVRPTEDTVAYDGEDCVIENAEAVNVDTHVTAEEACSGSGAKAN